MGVAAVHAAVTKRARHLEMVHAERLHCRQGCSSCCVDDVSVFEVEADRIREHHAALLADGVPHLVGGCAFLDVEGSCRIYDERPYVCRTQGLPLRWIEDDGPEPAELRDICPLNDVDAALEPLEALKAEDCFTLGPFEEALATLQVARSQREPGGGEPGMRVGPARPREADVRRTGGRTRLRDLFAARGRP